MLCNMNAVCEMNMLDGGQPTIVVVDTLPEHVRALGANQRARDIDMADQLGIPAHRALWRLYRKSIINRTVLVDGSVVAMFGISGTFLSRKGNPWFVASPFVEDYPIKLAFRYRSKIKNMLRLFPVLEDFVPVDDKKTIKLLEILGFEFSEPKNYNGIEYVKATLER